MRYNLAKHRDTPLMITYELAKSLKDAGFPMYQRAAPDGMREEDCYLFDGANYKIPTLEELIESCGNEEHMLLEHRNISGSRDWYVSFYTNHGMFHGIGKTLIVAVARLWLVLNKESI